MKFTENDDYDSDLDISWIKEQEKLEQINQNYFREPMENIDMFFIYINPNNYIDKITTENHKLNINENNIGVLNNDFIINIIQTKKQILPNIKYKLIDILLFNIDLEPENIQNYSKNENILDNSKHFFKVLSSLNDIKISPSIFIFHKINSLFFLFKQNDDTYTKPKSILKNTDFNNSCDNQSSHKTTKKVRIVLKQPIQKEYLQTSTRTTRKNTNK